VATIASEEISPPYHRPAFGHSIGAGGVSSSGRVCAAIDVRPARASSARRAA